MWPANRQIPGQADVDRRNDLCDVTRCRSCRLVGEWVWWQAARCVSGQSSHTPHAPMRSRAKKGTGTLRLQLEALSPAVSFRALGLVEVAHSTLDSSVSHWSRGNPNRAGTREQRTSVSHWAPFQLFVSLNTSKIGSVMGHIVGAALGKKSVDPLTPWRTGQARH